MSVVVVEATGTPPLDGVETVAYEAFRQTGPPAGATALVVHAPAPGWPQEDDLALAIGTSGLPAIAVRDARWDGFTPDPLAAVCRGVVSGFSERGLREAIALLERG